jgi:hypothetical protein
VHETCPLSPALSCYSDHLAFYDIVLTGRSFLYNQVSNDLFDAFFSVVDPYPDPY